MASIVGRILKGIQKPINKAVIQLAKFGYKTEFKGFQKLWQPFFTRQARALGRILRPLASDSVRSYSRISGKRFLKFYATHPGKSISRLFYGAASVIAVGAGIKLTKTAIQKLLAKPDDPKQGNVAATAEGSSVGGVSPAVGRTISDGNTQIIKGQLNQSKSDLASKIAEAKADKTEAQRLLSGIKLPTQESPDKLRKIYSVKADPFDKMDKIIELLNQQSMIQNDTRKVTLAQLQTQFAELKGKAARANQLYNSLVQLQLQQSSANRDVIKTAQANAEASNRVLAQTVQQSSNSTSTAVGKVAGNLGKIALLGGIGLGIWDLLTNQGKGIGNALGQIHDMLGHIASGVHTTAESITNAFTEDKNYKPKEDPEDKAVLKDDDLKDDSLREIDDYRDDDKPTRSTQDRIEEHSGSRVGALATGAATGAAYISGAKATSKGVQKAAREQAYRAARAEGKSAKEAWNIAKNTKSFSKGVTTAGKALSKAGAKSGSKAATKAGAKIGEKISARVSAILAAKQSTKLAGKAIPGVGMALSTFFAVKRAMAGDWSGAALEMSSGAAMLAGELAAPFTGGTGAILGAAAAAGIDTVNLMRDVGKTEEYIRDGNVNALITEMDFTVGDIADIVYSLTDGGDPMPKEALFRRAFEKSFPNVQTLLDYDLDNKVDTLAMVASLPDDAPLKKDFLANWGSVEKLAEKGFDYGDIVNIANTLGPKSKLYKDIINAPNADTIAKEAYNKGGMKNSYAPSITTLKLAKDNPDSSFGKFVNSNYVKNGNHDSEITKLQNKGNKWYRKALGATGRGLSSFGRAIGRSFDVTRWNSSKNKTISDGTDIILPKSTEEGLGAPDNVPQFGGNTDFKPTPEIRLNGSKLATKYKDNLSKANDKPKIQGNRWNLADTLSYLNNQGNSSTGHCARAVRSGLEYGGFDTKGRPNTAGEYHSSGFMYKLGFAEVPKNENGKWPVSPEPGDTMIEEGTPTHPSGHIAMWTGKEWVSDFKQKGYVVHKADQGKYHLYRFRDKSGINNIPTNYVEDWKPRESFNFGQVVASENKSTLTDRSLSMMRSLAETGAGDIQASQKEVQNKTEKTETVSTGDTYNVSGGDTINNNNVTNITNIYNSPDQSKSAELT